jgi:hypothetical protein
LAAAPIDRIFTSPGGSRGPSGTLAHNNFIRVWKRSLVKAELAHLWPEYGGLHFHDLRHTHATWLIAQRVPMIAVAGRLGHANAVVTMMVYAHVDKLVDRGLLTADELGLASPCQRRSWRCRPGPYSTLFAFGNSPADASTLRQPAEVSLSVTLPRRMAATLDS